MIAAAERLAGGQLTQLAERQARELYGPALVGLARRGKVPNVTLGHLAVRVLLFLLGQRPGYFAHQKVIAAAVESNLTSVRSALAELREARLVSWELIPPHHPLPTGSYTRTNVNRYYVDAESLVRALEAGHAAAAPKAEGSMRRNSDASTGTDLRSELDPPLPPVSLHMRRVEPRAVGDEGRFLRSQTARAPARTAASPSRARTPLGDRPLEQSAAAALSRRGAQDVRTVPPALEKLLANWRCLDLGEPDDRSLRALLNRQAEGATIEELAAAIKGARHDEWLRQGRAKSAFAVVFASQDSVKRFANAWRELVEEEKRSARVRLEDRRKSCPAADPRPALTRHEYARLANLALTACG